MRPSAGDVGSMARWLHKSVLVFLLLRVFVAFADTAPSNLPADEWLRGPARQDFPWKIESREPWLTFHQRIAVQVRASFRVRDLRKRGIAIDDLHVVFRVADASGKWFPGESYKQFDPKPDIGRGDEIDAFASIYAKPGDYQASLLVHDRRSGKGNVWHGLLHVPPLRDDVLADIDRELPDIQFLPTVVVSTSHPGRLLAASLPFEPSLFGELHLALPVANQFPVQVDILANLSLSDATNTRFRQAPDWMYQINADTLLQVAYVVSQLGLKQGCVRFSAIDVLRQQTFVDHEDAASVDWESLLHQVAELQRNKIEAKVLAQQKKTAHMLADYIERLINGPSACPNVGPPPVRVLVVIGDAFIFPNGSEVRAVRPESADTRGYYLKLMPIGSANWDQIERVIKPLHPRRSEFSDSHRFRKALASLVVEIENLGRRQPQQSGF